MSEGSTDMTGQTELPVVTLPWKAEMTTVEIMDLLGVLAQLGCTVMADIAATGRVVAIERGETVFIAFAADPRRGWEADHWDAISGSIRWGRTMPRARGGEDA